MLALPMRRGNDARAKTVRGFFVALMRQLWEEREGFSGKRPFGNSGWERDLEQAFGDAGLVELDEDGACWDDAKVDKLAKWCLAELAKDCS